MRRWRKLAPVLYAALTSAVVMALVGGIGMWVRQPWLFPSLGPTIFLQTVTPNQPSARPWNTIVGHLLGIVAGFAALFLFGAQHELPPMASGVLEFGRVGATALAVGLTIAGQALLRAEHPPAAATTMLLTLGGLTPSMKTVVVIIIGVALVTIFGEAGRWLHPERS